MRTYRKPIQLALLLALLLSACSKDTAVDSSASGGDLWQPCDVPSMGGSVSQFVCGRNGKLFAMIKGNVARSVDGGNTWSAVTASKLTGLVVDQIGNLYAGVNGVLRSTDDGSSWAFLGGDAGGVSDLALVSKDTILTVSYDDASCYRSTDAGQTWNRAGDIPGYGVALKYSAKTQTAYLHTFYHGANVRLWTSTDVGSNWMFIRQITGTSNYPGFIMAIDSTGGLWVVDSDGNLYGSAIEVRGRHLGTNAIEADASGLLMIGGNGGFQYSADGGQSWNLNNTGLTDVIVTAIGIRPGGLILVGTQTGKIYRSSRPVTN